MLAAITILSLLIAIFCLWMVWRLNLYIASLEIKIEENQELTENLLISLKNLTSSGLINPDGTMKKQLIP